MYPYFKEVRKMLAKKTSKKPAHTATGNPQGIP